MPPSSRVDSGDFAALGELSKARRMLVVNMFNGTRLKFGNAAVASNAAKLLSSGKSLASSGKKIAQGSSSASKALSVPGIKEAAEAQKVVDDGHNLYKHAEYREGFRPGDPSAAADAVKIIIRRDLAKHSVDLGRQALATGAKIAGACGDLGTGTNAAIGTANALAGLGLKLFALGIDIKDMRAGNKRLDKPDSIDHTVFTECPILGCCLLTCADTSSVANLFIADIGLPGWMDKVEKMKKEKMDPLLKIASKAIDSSPLQLDGLQSNKGTFVNKGFFARVKAKAVKKVMGA